MPPVIDPVPPGGPSHQQQGFESSAPSPRIGDLVHNPDHEGLHTVLVWAYLVLLLLAQIELHDLKWARLKLYFTLITSRITVALIYFFRLGLFIWRHKRRSSFNSASFLGLWLIPFGLSLYLLYLRFILVWSLYSATTGYYVIKSMRRPLDRSTPREVYRWFAALYYACFGTAMLGYLMTLSDIFGLTMLLGLDSLAVTGSMLMFYGMYFGLLDRDCAEWCTDHMAAELGIATHKLRNLPNKVLAPNICAICNDPLMVLGEGGVLRPREKTVTLTCGHPCHEFCIRGWTMIGKKDICPYPLCKEKVYLRDMFKKPWEHQTVMWTHLLEMLRYLIVWNPIILVGASYLLSFFDKDWILH